ncbi:putative serine/threonine protein kinase [Ampelomyces quisqualis]|uniref:Putative serine/threonine protein kinase n=1 Tax=Ampelomyces quisqualis TaxID=50730 RepID=A0A6A5QCB9_AMPQU|nr:putative serine/threonine protein kinase [Ampelomyces quisqualis]
MATLFRMGQILKGRAGKYTITKEIQDTVWFAKNHLQEQVVIKSVKGHPRVENERSVLRRFQHRTPYLRPLIDEIDEPSIPVTIALKYLQDDLLNASITKTLNRKELKFVLRCVLEALKTLHEDGFVHTDIKPNNVFVNLQEGDNRFTDVQLGDLGECYPSNSKWATSGTLVGAPIWSSPEILMELPWNTAADIWSFGAMLISLIYGGDFNLFQPKGLTRDDEEYVGGIVEEQFKYFGPFPAKIAEIADLETVQGILLIMQSIPKEKTTPFKWTTEREVSKQDNVFISKIMKLDWRDRPTATELLDDEWWDEDVK